MKNTAEHQVGLFTFLAEFTDMRYGQVASMICSQEGVYFSVALFR